MKQIIFLMLFIGSSGYFALAGDTAGVRSPLTSFNEIFKDAQNVAWLEGKEFSDVSFRSGGILMKARFDNAGNLLQTIKYYKEDGLPVFVMQHIKKQYKGYDIYGVTELSGQRALTYTLSLRNEKHWLVVITDVNGDELSSKRYNRTE